MLTGGTFIANIFMQPMENNTNTNEREGRKYRCHVCPLADVIGSGSKGTEGNVGSSAIF